MMEKFYKKSIAERREAIEAFLGKKLRWDASLPLEKADAIIENVVATGSLPFGVVPNLLINGKRVLAPMMVEEPSVVAAASKACKLSLPEGFSALHQGNVMLGMVQLKAANVLEAKSAVEANRQRVDALGKELSSSMEKRGGGWRGFFTETLATNRGEFLIVKFLVDVSDAMGANKVNTIAEGLAPLLEELTGGKALLRILSNFAVYRKVRVEATFHIDEVSAFLDTFAATEDLYRVVTNNKGFMNGVDAVALATGQDWRAIEAAVHSYAMVGGNRPIAQFFEVENGVRGVAELPLPVGVVGGATKVLPHAQLALEMMGQPSAAELASVMAAIGLANNFSANYALATTGIQKGHMKLHARVLALSLGATPEEADRISEEIEGEVSLKRVEEALSELRK